MTLMSGIVLAAGLTWIVVLALVWLLCRAAARADGDAAGSAVDPLGQVRRVA